jgi:hypothetical protein
MSKAMQESANVARRLGEIEATEKNQYIGQDPAFYQ